MKYLEFLKQLKNCPFCKLQKEEIVYQNNFGKIILALSPYRKDHLLVIPNKHVSRILELNETELLELRKLEIIGIKEISRNHKNFSVLYREGYKNGKTITHLHIHIIPGEGLGAWRKNINDREIYSKEEYFELTKEFKEKLTLKK